MVADGTPATTGPDRSGFREPDDPKALEEGGLVVVERVKELLGEANCGGLVTLERAEVIRFRAD